MTFVRVMVFSVVVLLFYTLFANILPQVQSNPPEEEEPLAAGDLDIPGMIAWGETLFSGKGTCTLCHNNMGRAPDLLAMDLNATFAERLSDDRYEGQAKDEDGAQAVQVYLHESMVDPSAFVVAGYGKKGTNDAVSPMPAVDKAPIQLSDVEINALIAFMQDSAGLDVTVPLPAEGEQVAAVETESAEEEGPAASAEEAIDKFGCAACHDLFGSEADMGPKLSGIGERIDRPALREAILDPNASLAEGYDPDLMPPDYGEQMLVSELEMIVDYLMDLPEGGDEPMMQFLRNPLLLAIVATVVLYVIFAYAIQPPLPKSLLIQYMIFSIIGILMVMTFSDATAKRAAAPIVALLGHPKLGIPRALALVLVVAGVSAFTYDQVKPETTSPVELRTVHPAPPSSIRVYGKSYDLLKLTNPLREQAAKGSEEFEELVVEGGELYYKNCIYCHGDILGGAGHFAAGFNPRPANFQDVGTIAQLQESYLFWRITTGAPGLPREGAPWASAMPVWHEMLSEDEVWRIILFLYDYTGFEPRSWELESAGEETSAEKEKTKPEAGGGLDEEQVLAVYSKRCAHCHGEEGDGLGPAAEFMYPLPRDFTLSVFKYKTTHADDEFPTDDDLRRTIREGLPGTSMPAWKAVLGDAEIDGLIRLIKEFGGWDEEEIEYNPIAEGERVPTSPKLIERGRERFVKACVQCHGDVGRGNITSGKKLKDDWENRIWPRNLTRPETWRYTHDAGTIFQRISTGIRGTPMPEHTTTMSEKDRWDVANYAMTLRDAAVPLTPGETVVRGIRVDGDLPTKPDDPAWEQAQPITFPLAPNIIKDGRLFFSLNDRVTVRVLFNDEAMVMRLDVDDRTYSVPGDPLEKQYRLKDVEPTRDAVAVQFPAEIPTTSEKPWFRHGDRKHPVNMWHWRAPSVEPEDPEQVVLLDAAGPDGAPEPRPDQSELTGTGVWQEGQWRIVLGRSLETEDVADLQFETGRYIPVAFADWDGLAGEAGSRHTLTSWYWLLLEPDENPALVYGAPVGTGLIAGLLFVGAARRQRRRFTSDEFA